MTDNWVLRHKTSGKYWSSLYHWSTIDRADVWNDGAKAIVMAMSHSLPTGGEWIKESEAKSIG